jgi:hypothetical protein
MSITSVVDAIKAKAEADLSVFKAELVGFEHHVESIFSLGVKYAAEHLGFSAAEAQAQPEQTAAAPQATEGAATEASAS